MSSSFLTTASTHTGVIGACWYKTPDQFLAHTDRFLNQAIGTNPIERRFIAMKGASQLGGGYGRFGVDSSDWLVGGGPFLDISAYALACATLPSNLPLYLIFNDTLFTRHPSRLISHRLAGLRDSLVAFTSPGAAAVVHPSTDLLLVDAHNISRHHLSTFCLLLNNSGFQIFQRLLAELPTSAEPEVIQAWINHQVTAYPALKALLHVHLFGPRTPWSWKHKDTKLFQRKAVTVIFEYLFTVKLLADGIGMPINHNLWYRLHSKLGRHG